MKRAMTNPDLQRRCASSWPSILRLDEVSAGQSQTDFYGAAQVQAARERLAQTRLEDQALTGLCEVAMALGVGSLRASLMAARVARLACRVAWPHCYKH
jgi:Mg-chelatase subunit ChlI